MTEMVPETTAKRIGCFGYQMSQLGSVSPRNRLVNGSVVSGSRRTGLETGTTWKHVLRRIGCVRVVMMKMT
jgi:hypothetical protein